MVVVNFNFLTSEHLGERLLFLWCGLFSCTYRIVGKFDGELNLTGLCLRTACAVRVTIFSTRGKFRQISNFT